MARKTKASPDSELTAPKAINLIEEITLGMGFLWHPPGLRIRPARCSAPSASIACSSSPTSRPSSATDHSPGLSEPIGTSRMVLSIRSESAAGSRSSGSCAGIRGPEGRRRQPVRSSCGSGTHDGAIGPGGLSLCPSVGSLALRHATLSGTGRSTRPSRAGRPKLGVRRLRGQRVAVTPRDYRSQTPLLPRRSSGVSSTFPSIMATMT